MGVWEYGSMGVWEYGSMGVWEYGSVGVWERGNMGAGNMESMERAEYSNPGAPTRPYSHTPTLFHQKGATVFA